MIRINIFAFTLGLIVIAQHMYKGDTMVIHSSPEENIGSDTFEGDIQLDDEEEEVLEEGVASAGIVGAHYRWPDRTIPYIISNDYNQKEIDIIINAMKEIQEKTCVRFKPRWYEKDYIYIKIGSGCSSFVGRINRGPQDVTLQNRGCMHHGIIVHELVHSIGFWHEQSRTDRDNYVQVISKNIHEENLHNFNAYTSKRANDFGIPYDYGSIMHYGDTYFIKPEAIKKGEKTIVPLKSGVQIGQRRGLSELDAIKINRMYCPEEVDPDVLSKYMPTTTTTTTTTTEDTTTTAEDTTTTTEDTTTSSLSTTTEGGDNQERKNKVISIFSKIRGHAGSASRNFLNFFRTMFGRR